MILTDILQPTHLLLILVAALVVLGPKRLPEAARSLGRGFRDFKGAVDGESRTAKNQVAAARDSDSVDRAV